MPPFKYHSARAEKARLAAALSRPMRLLLGVAVFILIVSGAALLLVGEAFGWCALGLAAVPFMILAWYHGELHDIPNGRGDGLEDIMSSALLGVMPEKPTLIQIAEALMKTPSGQFMAVRFGLTANMFANLLAQADQDSELAWEQARQVHRESGQEQVTGAVMSVALIRSIPGHEMLLAHMKLDIEDLLLGITWRQHTKEVLQRQYAPRRTGGVARDWSFGYIPLLERLGTNISAGLTTGQAMFTGLEHHQAAFNAMLQQFEESGRQNVVLVGPSGVGKTTLVYALADYLLHGGNKLPAHLQFRQVFTLDAATLIAAAPGRGEIEGLMMRIINEAHSAKNIILCLDDAQLFFEEGTGSVNIANVLQPILEAGNVRIILTVDEQRFMQISQQQPGLFASLNRINIQEPERDSVIKVLENRLIVLEAQRRVAFTYHAVTEAYRLGLRYVYDIAMPGRAFKVLEAAVNHAEGRLVTAASVVRAVEEMVGVKIGVADGEDDRTKLLNLESHIHQRMINQSRAVQVVSDALRRARSGVRNEARPIGTFLFLGPTGVGKTELAKALGEVYFGGEDRLIRIDLNEYVQPSDVMRLIADGATNPDSLTAMAMKQPFSVVLLDEIEKAHPSVLTTLLQLLDEGILRDEKNREVSFRDSIVIATSNAGADRIREYIDRGYQLSQFEEQFTNELISSGQFKPEFLNRFDEIVVFRPLEVPELRQIIDLIINGVNQTLVPQKISVMVSDEAKDYLVKQGYDPRLGARPIRRMVQRTVENIVAKQILADDVTPGQAIQITLADIEIDDSKEPTAGAPPPPGAVDSAGE